MRIDLVDLHPARMVDEQPARLPARQRERERDRGVEVLVGRGVAGGRIDVPEHLARAGLLQARRALAAAEEAFARERPADQPDAVPRLYLLYRRGTIHCQ